LDLFSEAKGQKESERIQLPDAELVLCRGFFEPEEADQLFLKILHETDWKQERISMFGKTNLVPRLTSWIGDRGKEYRYSGIRVRSEPWTPTLLEIKSRIEPIAGAAFNSVLLNLYRNGEDSVAWHSDDEPELGINPIIGSITFGETRPFQLKNKINPAIRYEILLDHGDFLVMRGGTQAAWLHQVPKRHSVAKPRVNLTFRVIDTR
jgi:alkylated DNA repair dioxygenase AlkB